MAGAVVSAMGSAITMAIAATTMSRSASLSQEGVVKVTVAGVMMPVAAVNATRSAITIRIAATITMLSALQEGRVEARCHEE